MQVTKYLANATTSLGAAIVFDLMQVVSYMQTTSDEKGAPATDPTISLRLTNGDTIFVKATTHEMQQAMSNAGVPYYPLP